MYDVQCSGTMSTDGQFSKKVHICYDALAWKADCINVLVQVEPPSILDITDLIRANADKFDLILTWREDLLDLPNAQKFIFGCCWIEWDTFKPDKQKVFPSIPVIKDGHQDIFFVYKFGRVCKRQRI